MAWKTVVTQVDGGSVLLLVDRGFAAKFPGAPLTQLDHVRVWCNQPHGDTFWAEAESDALNRLEEDLIRAAGELGNGWAVYVLRVCTPGIRDFYIYSGEGARLRGIPERLHPKHPKYRIESESRADASWSVYRKYLALANGPAAQVLT